MPPATTGCALSDTGALAGRAGVLARAPACSVIVRLCPSMIGVEAGDQDSGLRLAELVAAFSLATDLGLGQPMEHVLRSWLIAVRLGNAWAWPPRRGCRCIT